MSLITKNLTVKWAPANKTHFKELGYIFTEFGDEFTVPVEHLSKYCDASVDISCDYCDDIITMPYKQYCALQGDIYCCPECLKTHKKVRDENGNLQFIKIPYRDYNWLFNEYLIKEREAGDIAKECGINVRTLREWISILHIPDKRSFKMKDITKDIIEDLYLNKLMSPVEISKMFRVSDNTIRDKIISYGIPLRSYSETMKIYYHLKGGIEKARQNANDMQKKIKSSCRQRCISVDDFVDFSTSEAHRIRTSSNYTEWRNAVFTRDDYTCQCCGIRGGELNVHHIYNFQQFPELRFEISNGITLCRECHLVGYPNSFHTTYGEKNNTKDQLIEFLRDNNSPYLYKYENTNILTQEEVQIG